MSKSLLIALALDGAGWDPSAWRRAGADAARFTRGEHWLPLVREAQDAGISLVTLEDSHRLQSTRSDGEPDGRTDLFRGRLDAPMLAAWLAARTERIGLVAAADTTISEPYLLSAQIATIDFVSRGRAGWLLQVSGQPADGGYVGPRPVATGAEAVSEAREYLEVVRRLWDSWEDDAEVRDAERHRFFDRERVHHIDFRGAHLSVKGPSITPRPPQGQPPVAAVAGVETGAEGLALAAESDLVFLRAGDAGDLAALAGRVREAAAQAGSEPLLFADVAVATAGVVLPAVAKAGAPALVFAGDVQQQTNELAALAAKLDLNGVRLWPATLPEGLHEITRGLVAALGAPAGGPTLRGSLGLERPANRYAAEVAG